MRFVAQRLGHHATVSLFVFCDENKMQLLGLMIITTIMAVWSEFTFAMNSNALSTRFFYIFVLDTMIVFISLLLVWQKDSLKMILSYTLHYTKYIIQYNYHNICAIFGCDARTSAIHRAYTLNQKFVNSNKQCVICSQSMRMATNIDRYLLQCGHCYHSECLNQWECQQNMYNKWQLHYHCPLCRISYSKFDRFDYNYCTSICSNQLDEPNGSHPFYEDLKHRQPIRCSFPDRIKHYKQFAQTYGFIRQNGNRRLLLGAGTNSMVYKAYALSDRSQKYAAKITSYSNHRNKRMSLEQNRLLHRYGNGLYVRDIYDDVLNHRMIFILPIASPLHVWWNRMKRKFNERNCTTQERIIQRMFYDLLLSLAQLHAAGYVHCEIKAENILVTKKSECNIEWIGRYSFHIIDYGATVRSSECNRNECMDLYDLGMAICQVMMNIPNHNGDKALIRSVILTELQYDTVYSMRFKQFISDLLWKNNHRKIISVDSVITHAFFKDFD
eukprot:528774_1